MPFRLAVIAKTPVSPIERQNLEGIRLQYRYTDIKVHVEGGGADGHSETIR